MSHVRTDAALGRTTAGSAAPGRSLAAWGTLLKPRIASMVVLAALVGALQGGGPGAGLAMAFEAALWIGLVAASSSVFNQVLERDTDGLMVRTAGRPLVTGAVRVRDAILFGALLGTVGVGALALRFGALPALLALATLAAYALVYTPLKRHSSLNTVVGAIPGAMPPLLGYAALSGEASGFGLYLFAILFVWQFPHFMAIAWLYREDYARAGLRMLPALEGSAGLAGRQAALYGLVLLPVSLLPAVRHEAGAVYTVAALLLGLVYLAASVAFALRETAPRARTLLFVSLVYLPVLFSATLADPVVRILSSI
jgi:protoheme IX farnesyltransferase